MPLPCSVPRLLAGLAIGCALVAGAGPLAAQPAGVAWPEDPAAWRLFFGPTGRMLRAGGGSVGLLELIVPHGAYGFPGGLMISGGVPLMAERPGSYAFVVPKVRIVASDDAEVAFGAFALFGVEEVDAQGFGFAVASFGSRNDAVTAGAAVPLFRDSEGSGEVEGGVLLLFGGEIRTSRGVKVLTENYWISSEGDVLASGGVRLLRDRLTADLGFLVFFGDPVECCLPMVNVTYRLGR